MRSCLLVARREFIAYWTSPVAYVVLAVFAILAGLFFFGELSGFVSRSQMSSGRGVDVNQELIRPYVYSVSVVVLFLIPLVTMRLVAEEKRLGTLEILLTTPASEVSLVLGKFLASLGLFAILLVASAGHVALLFAFGRPELGPVLTGFLGLFLTGAAYLALGLFLSTLTQNQVVAATLGFSVFLLLWLIHWLGGQIPGRLGEVLTYVSMAGHFDSFGRGLLDSRDIIYYLSLTVAGVFGAVQSVTATRWKA